MHAHTNISWPPSLRFICADFIIIFHFIFSPFVCFIRSITCSWNGKTTESLGSIRPWLLNSRWIPGEKKHQHEIITTTSGFLFFFLHSEPLVFCQHYKLLCFSCMNYIYSTGSYNAIHFSTQIEHLICTQRPQEGTRPFKFTWLIVIFFWPFFCISSRMKKKS